MTKLSEQILQLRSTGKTYKEIAEITGASKGTISYWCGEDQRSKVRTRTQYRRRTISNYLQKLKQETSCADCGENYPYWIMEFDHLRDKEFQISRYRDYGVSLEKIKEEIKKCKIVCANCHKNRTYSRISSEGEIQEGLDVSSYYIN